MNSLGVQDNLPGAVGVLNPVIASKGPAARLLFLTDAFLPHAGGSRVYYFNLYQRLGRTLNVFVLTTKTAGSEMFDRAATSRGLKIIRRSSPLPDWRSKRAAHVLVLFFYVIVMKIAKRADMVHAGDLFPQGLACAWMRKLFGTPYLVYAHGEEITQTSQFRYQPRIRNFIYRRADAVIAANDFAGSLLQDIGVEANRIHTIYPGVDCIRFSPALNTGVLPADPMRRLTILSVGRLVPHKGHRILLQAIAALPPTTSRPLYVIAGEGHEKEALVARAAELGLTNDVVFLGKVSEEALPDLYRSCDLFALANCEHRGCVEGFGMVFLEAGACGKPVLAGRAGGTAGAVIHGETGLLVDADDLAEVTSALNQMLLDQDLRERMGRAGSERAIKSFDWDRSAEKLRELCGWIMLESNKKLPSGAGFYA